jgi:hypothetical protein
MRRFGYGCALILLLAATSARAVEKYDSIAVRGWTVLLEPRVAADDILMQSVLAVLDRQLEQLDRLLPAPALKELHKVSLYVSYGKRDSNGSAAYYRSDSARLTQPGEMFEMYQNIEILDATDYSRVAFLLPDLLLHEFAHAYMHRVLPRSVRGDLTSVYFDAVKSHVYDSVEHRHGRRARAYALKNIDEYFAEGSVAFFDTNQAFPFTRAELQAVDPELENILTGLWYHPERYDPSGPNRPVSIITHDTVVSGWRFRVVSALPQPLVNFVIDRFNSDARSVEQLCSAPMLATLKEIPVRIYTEESHWCDSVVDHISRLSLGGRSVEIAIGKPSLFAEPNQPTQLSASMAAALYEKIGGLDSPEFRAALDHATRAKQYSGMLEAVDKSRLDIEQLYIDALTRAYFNTRDGFPHNRDELKTYDPSGFLLISKIWSRTE